MSMFSLLVAAVDFLLVLFFGGMVIFNKINDEDAKLGGVFVSVVALINLISIMWG